MIIEGFLSEILIEGKGLDFLHFANSDKKYWIMPVHRMNVAMNLYQPSGIKGKLLKRLFPYLYRFVFIRKILQTELIQTQLQSDVSELLCRLFNVDKLEFSVFSGTLCVHQKITIQLSSGSKILGYCKVSDSSEILSMFYREAELLKFLKESDVNDIPECLYVGNLKSNIGMFVQSTVKTNKSLILHKWTELHERFLMNLYKNTKQKTPFEQTSYYRTLINLKSHFHWLPENVDRCVVEDVTIRVLEEFQEKEVEFSAYHADFTPWNMFVEHGHLFVFDFEYAQLSYPPMLDRYHFFTQTVYFERHWSAEDVLKYMRSDKGKWINKKEYLLYLLDVISRFTMRERGKVEGDMINLFEFWEILLGKIV